jgi:hypothetical protein
VIYLSGHVCAARHPRLGFLLTPNMGNRIPLDAPVAADNGCFSDPDSYDDDRYIKHLLRFERCLFAVAPDVVGDHAATVERSLPMLTRIRSVGHKVAFCAQDGWSEDTTPWSCFDVLFVGGTTEFKFRGGRAAVAAAKRRGKLTHMGRVNSMERLRAAASIGCDTADGTFLRFGPDVNTPKLLGWLDSIDAVPMLMER